MCPKQLSRWIPWPLRSGIWFEREPKVAYCSATAFRERKRSSSHRSPNYLDADQMITPRGLSKQKVAAYAGCETLSAFNRRGIMPGSIPGTHKWDRNAVDAALTGYPASSLRLSPYDHH